MTRWSRQTRVLAFCAAYLLLQLALIVSSQFTADKRFGFWMFAESSRYRAVLYRELDNGVVVSTLDGQWAVPIPGGDRVVYDWNNYVRDFRLYNLESWKRAKTGLDVTLKYLDTALDYVIDRIPHDRETVKLILKIEYSRAGGPVEHVTLESKTRDPRQPRRRS